MGDVILDGSEVHSEADLHRLLESGFEFGEYYGRNLAALRDRLLADVPRPVRLVWKHSAASRDHLGEELFHQVTEVLEEAADQDIKFGWEDRFEYVLS